MRMSIKYLRTNENNEEDKQNQQNLKQGHIRKKDVLMSKVGVYISIVIVFCHSIRLIPNTWEFSERYIKGDNNEDHTWPLWIDVICMLSNLALTCSSSITFYIYYAMYASKKRKFLRRFGESRRSSRRFASRITTNATCTTDLPSIAAETGF